MLDISILLFQQIMKRSGVKSDRFIDLLIMADNSPEDFFFHLKLYFYF